MKNERKTETRKALVALYDMGGMYNTMHLLYPRTHTNYLIGKSKCDILTETSAELKMPNWGIAAILLTSSLRHTFKFSPRILSSRRGTSARMVCMLRLIRFPKHSLTVHFKYWFELCNFLFMSVMHAPSKSYTLYLWHASKAESKVLQVMDIHITQRRNEGSLLTAVFTRQLHFEDLSWRFACMLIWGHWAWHVTWWWMRCPLHGVRAASPNITR